MTSSSRQSSRYRLHAGVAALGAAGGAWLVCASAAGSDFTICPFKLATGIACPACGSTRAVLALFEGRNPLQYNPVGILTFSLAVAALVLMVRDVTTGSDRLRHAWGRAEQLFRWPPAAVSGVALLSANWLWSISKGL